MRIADETERTGTITVGQRAYSVPLEVKVEVERLREVYHWAQAVVTAMSVGDLQNGSLLHKKLVEVVVAYREAAAKEGDHA